MMIISISPSLIKSTPLNADIPDSQEKIYKYWWKKRIKEVKAKSLTPALVML